MRLQTDDGGFDGLRSTMMTTDPTSSGGDAVLTMGARYGLITMGSVGMGDENRLMVNDGGEIRYSNGGGGSYDRGFVDGDVSGDDALIIMTPAKGQDRLQRRDSHHESMREERTAVGD